MISVPPKQSSRVSFAVTEYPSGRSCTSGRSSQAKAASHGAENAAPNPGQEETPAEVALLLTAVAGIATKEINADPPIMSALAAAFPRFPKLAPVVSDEGRNVGVADPRGDDDVVAPTGDSAPALLMHFDHRNEKMRSVSMDFPELRANSWSYAGQTPWSAPPPPPPPHEEEAIPILLQWRNFEGTSATPPDWHGILSTPPPSPAVSRLGPALGMVPRSDNPCSGLGAPVTKVHRSRPRAVSMAEGAIERIPMLDLTAPDGTDEKPKTLILRKKFSWKNYLVLEDFLIANREEYLRHSTLNYTMQQKKYNNKLTERMLKLAGEHGYMFNETEFSFVTVRDRIRCYYKSYVQSMKKRGVVIGYAARKAGLVTEEELEQSAHTNGKIYVPRN